MVFGLGTLKSNFNAKKKMRNKNNNKNKENQLKDVLHSIFFKFNSRKYYDKISLVCGYF